jgi:hypothetical protein
MNNESVLFVKAGVGWLRECNGRYELEQSTLCTFYGIITVKPLVLLMYVNKSGKKIEKSFYTAKESITGVKDGRWEAT